jgi:hypothetical protein
LIALILSGKDYKAWKPALCKSFQPPFTSFSFCGSTAKLWPGPPQFSDV